MGESGKKEKDKKDNEKEAEWKTPKWENYGSYGSKDEKSYSAGYESWGSKNVTADKKVSWGTWGKTEKSYGSWEKSNDSTDRWGSTASDRPVKPAWDPTAKAVNHDLEAEISGQKSWKTRYSDHDDRTQPRQQD